MNVVKCERFVRAMQKRELSAAFVSWEAEWRRLKSQRRALNKCVTRAMKRAVFSAFSAWASTTAELRRQHAIVKRAAAKIARNALATTFYDWQRKWRGKAEWEAKVARSGRFLAAMKSQTLSSAFAGWRDTHRKLRAMEKKVARCIQRMTQNAVARAFIDWAEKVEAKREAEEEADRARIAWEAKLQRAERFILAWTNRSLNDAFTQWKANFRILRADRERVAVAVARMVYRRAYGYLTRGRIP